MVKKTISFTLIILLLLLIYQFLVTLVKSNHYVTYTIDKEDEVFNVDEKYVKEDGKEYYIIKVYNEDKKFVWKLDNNFNKQKNIVNDLEIFEQNDYYCVGLSFVGNKRYSYPECIKNGLLMSYSSIKDKIDFGKYIDKIVDKNKERYSSESEKRSEESLIVNKDYLDNKEALIVYSYKTMSLQYSSFARSFSFTNYDNYKNILGTLTGKYYIVPRLTSLPTISTLLNYDVVDGIKKEISLPVPISKQSYVNGVYDNKLYIFDRSDKRQIEINPSNDEITIVGTTEQDGIVIRDGKKESISVYDLDKEDVLFTDDKSLYSNIDYDFIYVDNGYAVYVKDGSFYKVYNDFIDVPIYLFTEPTAHNIKVKNENIYYIKDDTIYKYNVYGSFPLAIRNEFIYNSDNIYDVYIYD